MAAFCKGRGSGSTWRGRGFNSATILTGFNGQKPQIFAMIAPQSGHDRAAIGPRSCVDRDPEAPSIVVDSSRIDSTAEDVRSRLDRTAILGFFPALSAPSDDAPSGWTIAITDPVRRDHDVDQPSDRDQLKAFD